MSAVFAIAAPGQDKTGGSGICPQGDCQVNGKILPGKPV